MFVQYTALSKIYSIKSERNRKKERKKERKIEE